jgi:GT2 family glycosyltransferase
VEESNDAGGSLTPASTWLLRSGHQVPDRPDVTVCVLVLDRTDLIEGCLQSVAHSTSLAVETIVVANGTPEAAMGPLTRREDIVLLRSSVNLGFGGGNNLAAEFAHGDYLVFVNDDSILDPGCVDRLVARASTDAGIGAVGSRIVSADGTIQEAGAVLWKDGSATHVGRGLAGDAAAFVTSRDVDYSSANGLLVRRSAWDAVGGFDEHYFPAYYEDVDLCMRLRAHGLRVVYEPGAKLVHLESQSTPDHFKAFLLQRHRLQFAADWADELADREPRPVTGKPAAVQRAIRRDLSTPPRPRRRKYGSDVAGAFHGDVPADRELSHATTALALKDEYIASLHRELGAVEVELAQRHRWRHRSRSLAKEMAARLPPRARDLLRSVARG